MSFEGRQRERFDDYVIIPQYIGGTRQSGQANPFANFGSSSTRSDDPRPGTVKSIINDMFKITSPNANTYIEPYFNIAAQMNILKFRMNNIEASEVMRAISGQNISNEGITEYLSTSILYNRLEGQLNELNKIYQSNSELVKKNPNVIYADESGIPLIIASYLDGTDIDKTTNLPRMKYTILNNLTNDILLNIKKNIDDGIYTNFNAFVVTYEELHSLMNSGIVYPFYMEDPPEPISYYTLINSTISEMSNKPVIKSETKSYEEGVTGDYYSITTTTSRLNIPLNDLLSASIQKLNSAPDKKRSVVRGIFIDKVKNNSETGNVSRSIALLNTLISARDENEKTNFISTNITDELTKQAKMILAFEDKTTTIDMTLSSESYYKDKYGVDIRGFTFYDKIVTSLGDNTSFAILESMLGRTNNILGTLALPNGMTTETRYSTYAFSVDPRNYKALAEYGRSLAYSENAVFQYLAPADRNEIGYIEAIIDGTETKVPFVISNFQDGIDYSTISTKPAMIKNKPLLLEYSVNGEPRMEVYENTRDYVEGVLRRIDSRHITVSEEIERQIKTIKEGVANILPDVYEDNNKPYDFNSFMKTLKGSKILKEDDEKKKYIEGKIDLDDGKYTYRLYIDESATDHKNAGYTIVLYKGGEERHRIDAKGFYYDIDYGYNIDNIHLPNSAEYRIVQMINTDIRRIFTENDRTKTFIDKAKDKVISIAADILTADNIDPLTFNKIERQAAIYLPVEVEKSNMGGYVVRNGKFYRISSDTDYYTVYQKQATKTSPAVDIYRATIYVPISDEVAVSLLTDEARIYYNIVLQPTGRALEYKSDLNELLKRATNLNKNQ